MSAMIPILFPPNFEVGDMYTATSGKSITWQDGMHLAMDGKLLKIDKITQDDNGITFYVEM